MFVFESTTAAAAASAAAAAASGGAKTSSYEPFGNEPISWVLSLSPLSQKHPHALSLEIFCAKLPLKHL